MMTRNFSVTRYFSCCNYCNWWPLLFYYFFLPTQKGSFSKDLSGNFCHFLEMSLFCTCSHVVLFIHCGILTVVFLSTWKILVFWWKINCQSYCCFFLIGNVSFLWLLLRISCLWHSAILLWWSRYEFIFILSCLGFSVLAHSENFCFYTITESQPLSLNHISSSFFLFFPLEFLLWITLDHISWTSLFNS